MEKQTDVKWLLIIHHTPYYANQVRDYITSTLGSQGFEKTLDNELVFTTTDNCNRDEIVGIIDTISSYIRNHINGSISLSAKYFKVTEEFTV